MCSMYRADVANLKHTNLPVEKETELILHCSISLPLSILLQNTDFKPVPLKAGEEENYMLALKQEMRGTMQRLPHNIKPLSNKAGEQQSSALES